MLSQDLSDWTQGESLMLDRPGRIALEIVSRARRHCHGGRRSGSETGLRKRAQVR